MNRLENILLILNPIAGNTDKKTLLNKLGNRLSADGKILEIHKTTGENDQLKIEKAIKKNQPDRILVAGGDGTIKLVAGALHEKKIPIGILPVGSANGLASDLDLPVEPDEFIKIALGKKIREIDAIQINDQLCLHMGDFGLNAELIKNYEAGNLRGKLGYAMNSISTLYNSEMPYLFTIEANGKKTSCEGIMLGIANSRKYGTGALVNPMGKIDDGKFELLIFKKFDIFEILKTLRGDVEMSPGFVESISTDRANITTLLPIDFQIDGEYCGTKKEITAKILPKKLHIATK
ncbi:MAG TPA: diacylglycerol kinase family protein [Flavobacteriaceae bacterium]|nr:diacylglycerol kinase family protein [Flavobacteriaceae bacterium]